MAVPNISTPNLSPALLTGLYGRPEYRGKEPDVVNASLPTYSSWEEALAALPTNPAYLAFSQGNDTEQARTAFLQDAYGLPQSYGVQGGRIVSTDHSLRNGLLGGAALLGGVSALGALGGGAAGAAGAAGSGTAGAGGVASAVHEVAQGALGLGGASGAAAGVPSWLKSALTIAVPAATQIASGVIQTNAQKSAQAAQQAYLDKALQQAKEEQEYNRRFQEENRDYTRKQTEEQRDYSRGQYGSYLTRLSPYAAPGPEAVSRLTALLTGGPSMPGSANTNPGGLIPLKAPDGTVSQVPAEHADHYLRLGATRV